LLDLRLAGKGGLDLLRSLHEQKLAVPVVLLMAHANIAMAVQAIKLGALDVIEKPFKDEALVAAVRSALDTYERWHKQLQERQLATQRIDNLTPREIQVLDLMVTGLPNRMIAEELGISPKTLDIHRSNVMDKMQARTTADLVRARLLERADPRALPYLFG
jgi:two-component system response regulator FixJ